MPFRRNAAGFRFALIDDPAARSCISLAGTALKIPIAVDINTDPLAAISKGEERNMRRRQHAQKIEKCLKHRSDYRRSSPLYKAISSAHYEALTEGVLIMGIRRNFGIIGLCALTFFVPAQGIAQEKCKAIASIYEQDICEVDIRPSKALEKNIREYAEQAGQKPEKAIDDFKMSSLFGLLWEKALVHKYGPEAIQPSDDEVESYLDSFHEAIEHQNGMNEEMSKLIAGLLEENKYADGEKQKLDAVMAQSQKAITMYNMREALPEESMKQMEEGERKMAEAMVKSWKIKKTLFKEYGGRVVSQQAGLEPLDAFQTFLKELEGANAVIVHDEAYKDVMKTMDAYINKEHEYLPEDSDLTKEYFDTPSWVYDKDAAEKAFEKQKQAIKEIPAILPAEGDKQE